MREYIMKKKKKKIETVRLMIFDQEIISVVSKTVSRKEILENFIIASNEMMMIRKICLLLT